MNFIMNIFWKTVHLKKKKKKKEYAYDIQFLSNNINVKCQ